MVTNTETSQGYIGRLKDSSSVFCNMIMLAGHLLTVTEKNDKCEPDSRAGGSVSINNTQKVKVVKKILDVKWIFLEMEYLCRPKPLAYIYFVFFK